jgi:hypothetical protein
MGTCVNTLRVGCPPQDRRTQVAEMKLFQSEKSELGNSVPA